MAAEASGNRQKASDNFAKLIAMTKDADSGREELRRAKAYVAVR